MTATPSVVLGMGMGADSVALLVRWLLEPESRNFNLSDLVVITAMTGDEWPETGALMEQYVLPLLREHGLRYIQVARSAPRARMDGTGVVVLDDSTTPTRMHMAGAYTLADEMISNGTVPQTGGRRDCSMHAKGEPLDATVVRVTGGRPFRHVIGYEANEPRRAATDARFNTCTGGKGCRHRDCTRIRTGWYPLIEWGWDREVCEAFLLAVFGVRWPKSACTYCPFALASRDGRRRTLARYEAQPERCAEALWMEHVAVCLNEHQGLIKGDALVDLVRAEAVARPGLARAVRLLETRVAAVEHAVYHVRRLTRATTGKPMHARSVRRVATGTRDEMRAELARIARAADVPVLRHRDGTARAWVRIPQGDWLPIAGELYTVGPAVVVDKERSSFAAWWAEATHPQLDVAL